jgi:hypothetical protein
VNNKLSPGKKKPISRPDSAKTIPKIPKYPTVFIKLSRSKSSISYIYYTIKEKRPLKGVFG